MQPKAIIVVIVRTGGSIHPYLYGAWFDILLSVPQTRESGLVIGRLLLGRHSLRSEALITNPRFKAFSSEVAIGSREENASKRELYAASLRST
jgi:hypothetical protein